MSKEDTMSKKEKPIYHVGIGKNKNTMVIIQAVKCIDYLSCEIYDYMGLRQITKKELYKNRYKILDQMKKQNPEVYKNCKYAIVE
jgi:hypothetical protein